MSGLVYEIKLKTKQMHINFRTELPCFLLQNILFEIHPIYSHEKLPRKKVENRVINEMYLLLCDGEFNIPFEIPI